MVNFKNQISSIDIHHSCNSLNPSYEVRCNKIKNSSIGIRVEANSTVDDLGDPQNPSANKWSSVNDGIIVDLTSNFGFYYQASNENLPPPTLGVPTQINIKNSCQ